MLRTTSAYRYARNRRTSEPPLARLCPDRRWRLWTSRSSLLKGIANRIENVIPFCNARSPSNRLLLGCCETGRLRKSVRAGRHRVSIFPSLTLHCVTSQDGNAKSADCIRRSGGFSVRPDSAPQICHQSAAESSKTTQWFCFH